MEEKNIPTVEATKCKDGSLKFYCQYCKTWHYHGGIEGHRWAHCFTKSPYMETGYYLVLKKEPSPTE